MKKSNFSVCGAFCFWLGCAAAFAALALRCVQVFKYTDYETAHVLKSASESVAAFLFVACRLGGILRAFRY